MEKVENEKNVPPQKHLGFFAHVMEQVGSLPGSIVTESHLIFSLA